MPVVVKKTHRTRFLSPPAHASKYMVLRDEGNADIREQNVACPGEGCGQQFVKSLLSHLLAEIRIRRIY